MRVSLSTASREPLEALNETALRVKCLTTSLLYMVNPSMSEDDVKKRSNWVAQDSVLSFVSHLIKWKQSANQLATPVT